MNIIVTGSNGQIGSDLQKNFNKKNFNVFFLDKKKLNLLDFDNLKNCIIKINPSIIINCAAFTDVDKAENKKKDAFSSNCIGVKNLAILCNLNSIYLIHFSTDFIFDGSKKIYNEDDIPNPINFYGKTKYIAEKIITKHMNKFLILRVSWLIGPYGNNFLIKIYNALMKLNEIKVVDDQISNPTTTYTISAVVNICCNNYLNNNKRILNGIYNLSCDPPLSKYDLTIFLTNKLVDMGLIKNTKNIIKTKTNNNYLTAKRPLYSSLNNYKIKQDLDIKDLNWKNQIENILNQIHA